MSETRLIAESNSGDGGSIGKIYDEQGKDAMEWVEEVDPFHLETLTTLRKYQQAQPSEQEWMRQ
ncbi:uncharacterized protein RHIMIDRAFT_234401 [Rhizopus microsporus ATCC 52813]|uniref:Uncharacterized protein n=1 Tax=Rhizopus microsporus ATCC 52813 TaxID=1340429 RepID=A0A2G4T731_RHIZD|nr:uncharacterized protein RHIMIDRAFT_234401 [Rhizopus microsporus ATCC 52813]PHZ16807.1 hypothetical protein RHIMIDRAFT_234401 [Rhizopus microsporus ATCC 52813]